MQENINNESVFAEDIEKLKGPILIFGVSGFEGSNIFRKILKHRDDCFGVLDDNKEYWRLKNLPLRNLKKCDITKVHEIESLINNLNPKTIYNFAEYGSYSYQQNVKRIYDVNFTGLGLLLDTIKNKNISAFIQAGSYAEYGFNSQFPDENSSLEPYSEYSVSKIASNYLIKYFGNVYNLPIVNLRFYSVYGPWEEPDRLVSQLIVKGFNKQYPSFASPTVTKDFIYIDDAINAVLKASLTAENFKGETFNVASGLKTSLQDLANFSKNHFEIPFEPSFFNFEKRDWDLDLCAGNIEKTINLLNWKPQININDGLIRTASWMKNKTEFYKNYILDKTFEKKDKISAIIVCYRDEPAIPVMYERLVKVFNKLVVNYEIIFVNDRSPDNSEEEIKKLSENDHNVIGITHSRNFGAQPGFLSGMEICSGNIAVLLDGDLQDPPELIEDFYKKWKEGYDVVYGIRQKREMSPFMEFLFKTYYRIFKFLADIEIPNDAGDFSLLDRKVINQLLLLPEKDVFLRGLRAWVGFKQTGIPYYRPERMFGKSTNNIIRYIWWAKKGIFSFSYKPLEYISYAGFFIFVFAFLFAIVQFIIKLMYPSLVPTGLTTIILLILLIGGVQLFAISIIGEYIAKIIEETKGRPRFIRKAIINSNIIIEDVNEIEDFINKQKIKIGNNKNEY